MSRRQDDELPIISDDELENNHGNHNRSRDNELDPSPTGCGVCDPRSGFHRFIALVFMCLLGFGE